VGFELTGNLNAPTIMLVYAEITLLK